VGAADEIELVDFGELADNTSAKEVSCAAVAEDHAVDVLGVRPDKVAEGAVVGDLLSALDGGADLVDGSDVWAEATVDAQDLAVDQRSHRQVVEHLCAPLPRVCVPVLLHALIVEPVHLCDLSAFVVSSQQCDLRWEAVCVWLCV